MPRKPKPCMRRDGYWYATLTVNGKKTQFGLGVRGPENEAQAWAKFTEIKDRASARGNQDYLDHGRFYTVKHVCDYFKRYSEKHSSNRRSVFVGQVLDRFCTAYGSLSLTLLKPAHVEDWLDRREWSANTRYGYGATIKAAFNCALRRERINSNPIRSMKLPAIEAHIQWLTEEQEEATLTECKKYAPDFYNFIWACLKTGARPIAEVASVTLDNTQAFCDLQKGVWLFRKHKTSRKTGGNREVILRPDVVALCAKLGKRNPQGPLFRSQRGNQPWTKSKACERWETLRARVGLPRDMTCYCLRHTFATRLLDKGVGIAKVAAYLGNTIEIAIKHYGHVDQTREYRSSLDLLG